MTTTKAPHPKNANGPEVKVSGVNACRALFEKRREDIRRAYVTDETMGRFGDVLKWCAQNRIAYHVVTKEDLHQFTDSVHHDGVCFIAREKKPVAASDLMMWAERLQGPGTLVLLEDVKNPHNLGAILRVCAHFGVKAVLAAGDTAGLSMATMRTAEGGAEHVDVVPVGDGAGILQTLKGLGFSIIATTSHTQDSLERTALPARSVVMFGSEGEGLSRRLFDKADRTVAIPGSGALESLNVACAASVVLWELWQVRAQHEGRSSTSPAVAAPTSAPRAGRTPWHEVPSSAPTATSRDAPMRQNSSRPDSSRPDSSPARAPSSRQAPSGPRGGRGGDRSGPDRGPPRRR